jgi:membrane protein
LRPYDVWPLLKESFSEWNDNNVSRLGAALAYYSAVTIAPLLILVIALAGHLFGSHTTHRNIVGDIEGTMGKPMAKAVEQMLVNNNDTNQGALATVVGLAVLLLGAAGAFNELQQGLNALWKVAPSPYRGLRGLLWDRCISFSLVLGSGFLLLVSLVIHAVLSALSMTLSDSLPGGAGLWQMINVIVSFAVVTVLFALIFKFVPDAHTAWNDVWVGAVLTSVLFAIGKFLLGWYLGQASTTSAYGAAASLVVVLLWVYYASQILLFGAAFTRVYALRVGSGIKPSILAVSTEPTTPPRKQRDLAKTKHL